MPWPVRDLHELAILIVAAGDCFLVRQTLQRLERGEITVCAAIELLKAYVTETTRQT